jgi:hypothetical protein
MSGIMDCYFKRRGKQFLKNHPLAGDYYSINRALFKTLGHAITPVGKLGFPQWG